jgi:hypothetical protein
LLAVSESKDAKALENELHQIYSGLCIRGEWFRLSADDVNDIVENFGFTWKNGRAREEVLDESSKDIYANAA